MKIPLIELHVSLHEWYLSLYELKKSLNDVNVYCIAIKDISNSKFKISCLKIKDISYSNHRELLSFDLDKPLAPVDLFEIYTSLTPVMYNMCGI